MKRARILLLALLLAAWPAGAVVLIGTPEGKHWFGFTEEEMAKADAYITQITAERDELLRQNKLLVDEVNKLRLERQIPPFPRAPLVGA